jgi:hypothetical protein
VNKSSLTRSIKPELRAVVIIRTARTAHQCVCAPEFQNWTVTSDFPHPVDGVTSVSSTWDTLRGAETHADWARRNRPEAEVSVTPNPNPNHRPGCLGVIDPGGLYADYIGEAGFAESGRPYCASCLEVWQ